MAQLSGKQLATILGTTFIGALVAFGYSKTGQRCAVAMARPFSATWNFLLAQKETLLADEDSRQDVIADLKKQIGELEQAKRENKTLRRENKQLRHTLALGNFPAYYVMRAEIITRDPVTWNLQFTIDRGQEEGVKIGAPVLYQKWMIGRVASVNQHSATVHTVVSPQCRIGVAIENTQFHGLLSGMGRIHQDAPGCLVDFLPLEATAKLEQKIVTSGLGGTIPEGIPIASIQPNQDGMPIHEVKHARKRLFAKPLADWNDMRIVSLLLPK